MPRRVFAGTETATARSALDHTMSVILAFIVEDIAVILDSLIAMLEEMVPVKVVGTADDEATAVAC